jgi:APA family basic amino acid/polyamine antiporter
MKNNIFRVKAIEKIIESARRNPLKKTLGAFDLVLIAIGCTIGTGIFVFTGIAAAKYAGPAISVSYALAAIACMLAGLAYIELAAMMPVAGSAYTYSYAVLGEFVAWIVATALILEYMLGASSVAAGWSGYFVGLLSSGGITIPEYLTKPPVDGGIINLPAVLITLLLASLLIRGTKQGININRILVAIKLGAVFLFIIVAVPHVKLINWTANFAPFGFHGIIVGAATVFLAYIGFDAVATAAEECKNPNRDIPIGIIAGLLVCTVLYVSVALILTGITNYTELNNPEPLSYALRQNGSNIGSAILATGAIGGIASVLLVLIYGNSRILFVISRDGLLPKFFSKIHPKFDTPHLSIALVSIVIALIAGFCKLETIWQISSLGALFAFLISSIAVMVLRIKKPHLKRPFKCPMLFVIAPLSILACGYLIINLLSEAGEMFFIAILASLLIYFGYSYKKSPVNKIEKRYPNGNFKSRYKKPYNNKNRNKNLDQIKTADEDGNKKNRDLDNRSDNRNRGLDRNRSEDRNRDQHRQRNDERPATRSNSNNRPARSEERPVRAPSVRSSEMPTGRIIKKADKND